MRPSISCPMGLNSHLWQPLATCSESVQFSKNHSTFSMKCNIWKWVAKKLTPPKTPLFHAYFRLRYNNPFSAGATFLGAMLTQSARSRGSRPLMAVAETCISAFAVCRLAHTPGRKIIPRKEAYKLARVHAREQIGAVEVSDIASTSHESQQWSGDVGFCVATSHDNTTHRRLGASKGCAFVFIRGSFKFLYKWTSIRKQGISFVLSYAHISLYPIV